MSATITKSELDELIARAVKRALKAERPRIESAVRKAQAARRASQASAALGGLDRRLAQLRLRLERLVLPEQRR